MDNAVRNSNFSGQNRRFFNRNQIQNAVVISIVLVLGFQWRLLVSVTGPVLTAVRKTPTSFIRQGHFVLGTCGRSPSPKVCRWMAEQQPPSIFATQHQHLVVPFLRQTVSSLVSATTQLAGISHNDSDVLGVMDDCRDIMKLVRSDLTEATEVYGTPRGASLGEVVNFATVYLESCAGFVSEAGDKAVNTSFLPPFLFHQRRVASMLSILSWLLEEVEMDGVDRHSVLSHWLEPAATAVGSPDGIDGRTWKANLTVAKDGSGDCSTIMEALARAPLRSTERFTIVILAGIYEEYVMIGGHMTNIHFVGESRRTTIITGNRSRIYTPNVTTAGSATVGVYGNGFTAEEITIRNTAGPDGHQAVALTAAADQLAFYRCNFSGFQDTLFTRSGVQFFRECSIEGTVDFIFGKATATFQDCKLLVKRPNKNQKIIVTADGTSARDRGTGLSFHRCFIGAVPDLSWIKTSRHSTYLGRPWRSYATTVFLQTHMGHVVHPSGWLEWDGKGERGLTTYGEYHNTGSGSKVDRRVKWGGYNPQLSGHEVQRFSSRLFLNGSIWLGRTGFPFDLDA